jgi:integrase
MRYLTADEVESVADATDERYRALVLVAAYGGLRLGEMRALRWENVDLMARTIRVVEQADDGRGRGATKPPKTAAGRRSVSLPRFVVAELIKHGRRQHQTDETRCNSGEAERPMLRLVADGAEGEGNDETPTWTGLVFQAPGGGPIDQNHLRNRVWIPAVKAAGIGPMRFHDLRHTCASLAIAAGADVKALQAMLGHASAAMTLDRYGHLMPGQAEAVADRFDALHEARAAKRSKVG